MNTTTLAHLRSIAGPIAAAGIIGGALGLAAVANASTALLLPLPRPAAHAVRPATIAKATHGGEPSNAGGLMQATYAKETTAQNPPRPPTAQG